MSKSIFKAFNEITRKYEQINVGEAELLPGQIVVKMFWCRSASCYVTIPGASLYQVKESLDLIEIDE